MKKTVSTVSKCSLAVAVLGVAAAATWSLADLVPAPGPGCPRTGECPQVYDPVICDNGQVYTNSCYAYLDCATGCVPFGFEPM